MSILQEILAWSQELPAWQSDAVARLLAKQVLTADDRDDLFTMLKSAHGIPDPKGRTPKPLTADQIPALVKVTTHIGLLAMKNMRHVNAIAENQHLVFGVAGMTVTVRLRVATGRNPLRKGHWTKISERLQWVESSLSKQTASDPKRVTIQLR
ncbi:hypothetical protein [Castellaniella sp.]|uniref:hypothetical protein n=1 Tax=Castellaniella sp. TaxID=1955812 RepID=UPI0025B9FA39|nr:hypothetical protein [Castellaniella sp.]